MRPSSKPSLCSLPFGPVLVDGVDDLIDYLRVHGLLTKSEKKALERCVAEAY